VRLLRVLRTLAAETRRGRYAGAAIYRGPIEGQPTPFRTLVGCLISQRARWYLRRAGVRAARLGSHTLRHSLAVELLQRGHPLKTIGDLLGHGHPQATFIYTKADIAHLREVALGVEEIAP